MHNCSNPCESLQSVQWDDYRHAAFNGQIASGILVAITAIAVVTLLALHPEGGFVAANSQVFIALSTVGGGSLVLFAISSCIHYCGVRKMKQDIENLRRIEEIREMRVEEVTNSVSEEVVEEPPVSIEENPIEHIKQALLIPILKSFQRAVLGVVMADCVTTSRDIGTKPREVKWAFQEGEELFSVLIDNPRSYISELLRYFGRGKTPPSIALRRTVAAFNSGDPEKYAEVKKEYEAIRRGHDLSDIAADLRTKSDEVMMRNFPALLEEHFSLPDEPLKVTGKKALDYIFETTKANSTVLTALAELKEKAASTNDIAKDVEAFIKIVFEEANVSKEKLDEWNNELVDYMLNVQFKKMMCRVLGMMARNIRILRLMFDKSTEKEPLFITLDETFLISESSDCIKREGLQKAIINLQSRFNYSRKEKERIAFIALPKEDKRDYNTLKSEEAVVEFCCKANKHDLSELTDVSNHKLVKELGIKHGVRLVAVPVSISDHPFKLFKNHETAIRWGAWLLKPFLPGLVKPKLLEILPKMEKNEHNRFDKLFETLLDLLVNPIYDGSIGNTDFREPFERIITDQGEALAAKLEELVLDKEISFEKISAVWTEAVGAVAVEFEKVRQK